jgi:hypothetical protein
MSFAKDGRQNSPFLESATASKSRMIILNVGVFDLLTYSRRQLAAMSHRNVGRLKNWETRFPRKPSGDKPQIPSVCKSDRQNPAKAICKITQELVYHVLN